MTLSRRKFSAEFKLRAVRQVEAGASVAAVARLEEQQLPSAASSKTR